MSAKKNRRSKGGDRKTQTHNTPVSFTTPAGTFLFPDGLPCVLAPEEITYRVFATLPLSSGREASKLVFRDGVVITVIDLPATPPARIYAAYQLGRLTLEADMNLPRGRRSFPWNQ